MKRKKTIYYILIFLFFHPLQMFSQYQVSGYIDAKDKNKTIYLSLLKYDEENAISHTQILTTVKTDSAGYFEITGKLLPDENMLYRIHSNKNETNPLYEFIESGIDKNYHNFIFSNQDTIFFQKDNTIWFDKPINTNPEDKEWRKLMRYEDELRKEHYSSENHEALILTENQFINKYKSYCQDSLSGCLVKLLAFSQFQSYENELKLDFNNNPSYYYKLLSELEIKYSGNYYYKQYKSKLWEISAAVTEKKYHLHRTLNFILTGLIFILLTILTFTLKKLNIKQLRITNRDLRILTEQEKKVAKTIATGKTNKEIANTLFVSLSTVKTHISNINSKLHVKNRQELIKKVKNHTGD